MRLDLILFVLLAAWLIGLACWWAVRAYGRAGEPMRPRGPWGAAVAAGAAVVGIYLLIGSPGMADAAYADRMAALRKRAPETFTAEEVIAVLSAAARRRPHDAAPLILLGRVEAEIGRPEPAVRAYDEALRRDPQSVEAMVGLGRVLVAIERGGVTPQAKALFERAAERAPHLPEPWFYQALAARQDGRSEDALRLWRATLARLPENDRRREMVKQMIEESP